MLLQKTKAKVQSFYVIILNLLYNQKGEGESAKLRKRGSDSSISPSPSQLRKN